MRTISSLLRCAFIIVLIYPIHHHTALSQKMSIPNPTVDFGTLLQGSYPDTSLTFNIQNTGGSNLRIDSITGIKAPFHITTSFPVNIPAGGSEGIVVSVNRNFAEDEYFNRPAIYSNDTSFFNFNKVLTLYYPFNGNTQDSSVSRMHASSNEIEPATDRFGNSGKAILLKNVSYIRVSDSKAFKPDSAFTISIWFNLTSLYSNNPVLAHLTNIYEFDIFAQQMILYYRFLSQTVTGANNTVNFDEWYHAALTYDSKTLKLYQNGILIAWKEVRIPIDYTGAKDFFIGTYGNPSTITFAGRMDEFLIYNRDLPENEIYDLFTNTIVQLTISANLEKKQPEISVLSDIVDL